MPENRPLSATHGVSVLVVDCGQKSATTVSPSTLDKDTFHTSDPPLPLPIDTDSLSPPRGD
ncbi:hypothetical protein J6590_003515 [Homalodisca vitripennis]|nr:hypothetical protein J6590_003515 [Homalodisca vitripennis]